MTLVIMAAGMGSRFGGLKQIEPVGPNGEFIIDYSIYDAIQAGFTKVIFIIKEENFDVFKDTIGKRIEGKINVEYVFQDIKNIPNVVELPETRIKPLGTGHALYSAINSIEGPFAVISADDFYGREPFLLLKESMEKAEFSVIGYKIGNTLTENGVVKRGVCFEENGILTKIVESKVERNNGKIIGQPLNGDDEYEMEENHPVSMLMYGMQDSILEFLKEDMSKFLYNNKEKLDTCEYLLPDVLNDYSIKYKVPIKLIPTSSVWMGVTYSSDVEKLKNHINRMINEEVYTKKLY